MAGRTGAKAEEPNLSTTSCPAGLYSEARWETAAVRGARYPRSDGGNGGGSDPRTHIRGGPAARTVCLSARPQRDGRGKTRPQADSHWAWRSCRCRPQQLLRYPSTLRPYEVGGSPSRRRSYATPD